MKRGRPANHDRLQIKKRLFPYYQKAISASATANETKTNIKTVLKYFKNWDKEILESEDKDFLKRAKIEKEKTLQSFDYEIISLDNDEKEINSIKDIARKTGNVLHFEKLSRLKLKISDQKFKILAARINLINTPTADEIINLEEKNE